MNPRLSLLCLPELRPTASSLPAITQLKLCSPWASIFHMDRAELLNNVKGSLPSGHCQVSTHHSEIEARIFQHLGSHARVVRFISWDSDPPILRTEYMINGNLKKFISSNQPSTQEKFRWIKQAGEAIKVLRNNSKRSYKS
jgi:hypothetical protein